MCPGIRDARHQSFSASTQPSQTRYDRPKRTDFMGGKQTPLNLSDRATTISLNPSDRATTMGGPPTISRIVGMNDRQICIANQYPQSRVLSEKMNVVYDVHLEAMKW